MGPVSLAAGRQEASIAAGLSHARYARALGRLEWGTSRNFRKPLSGPTPFDQEALGNWFPGLQNLSKIAPKLFQNELPEANRDLRTLFCEKRAGVQAPRGSVSYTHLTLPTSDLV